MDYYKSFLIGENPLKTEKLTLKLGEKQNKILGSAGLHTQVLAAIIIACWDIRGKMEGKSIHSLLGGQQKRVRAYIAGGYYAKDKGLEELKEELLYNVNTLNATAVKIKIGDPSAGIAMFTAIVSAFTGVPIKNNIAMTGEITLRGRVLPIGGLKEKLLAAVRGGIKEVIIPSENKKDLADIDEKEILKRS